MRYRGHATGFEIACSGLLFFSLSLDSTVWNALPVPLSAALILQMATCPGYVSGFLQGRIFAALGNASYSIYLLHIPLLSMFVGAGLVSLPLGKLTPLWCVYFGGLLLLAMASFRYFERPSQRGLMRLFKGWRTSTSSHETPA